MNIDKIEVNYSEVKKKASLSLKWLEYPDVSKPSGSQKTIILENFPNGKAKDSLPVENIITQLEEFLEATNEVNDANSSGAKFQVPDAVIEEALKVLQDKLRSPFNANDTEKDFHGLENESFGKVGKWSMFKAFLARLTKNS